MPSAVALERLVVLDLPGGRMSGGDRVVAELRDELFDRRLGVESHFARKRPHEPPAEDASRQTRDVVALEPFEDGNRNLRGVRDLAERDPFALASLAQAPAEISGLAIGWDTQCAYVIQRAWPDPTDWNDCRSLV